jgi:hypothetical protein
MATESTSSTSSSTATKLSRIPVLLKFSEVEFFKRFNFKIQFSKIKVWMFKSRMLNSWTLVDAIWYYFRRQDMLRFWYGRWWNGETGKKGGRFGLVRPSFEIPRVALPFLLSYDPS